MTTITRSQQIFRPRRKQTRWLLILLSVPPLIVLLSIGVSLMMGDSRSSYRSLLDEQLLVSFPIYKKLPQPPESADEDESSQIEQQLLIGPTPELKGRYGDHPTIHVLGERHSGTKWITAHLKDCFSHVAEVRSGLTRWKHWFQVDGDYHYRPGNKTVVVAQFRHVLQWVKAMQVDPYHSPAHFNLSVMELVEREWTMPRWGQDLLLKGDEGDICQYDFKPRDVIPCLEYHDAIRVHNDRQVFPVYEMRNDGSGLPYSNILEFRRDKVRNFVSIRDFDRVDVLHTVQYEQMVKQGTESLIRAIEKDLNVQANCKPSPPQPDRLSYRPLIPRYLKYMAKHVDWETEAMIGYKMEWYPLKQRESTY